MIKKDLRSGRPQSDSDSEEEFFRKLITLSRSKQYDAFVDIDWTQSVDLDVPWMPFELTTLYQTPEWNSLSSAQRIRLTQLETLNIFSMTLVGEAEIKRELADFTVGRDCQQSTYLALFMREESNHTLMFRRLFETIGVEPYRYIHIKFPGAIPRGLEKLVAFGQTLIAEEVLTYFNAKLMNAPVPALIKEVHSRHHADESRHIAMGRTMVRSLWSAVRESVGLEALDTSRKYLREYCFFFCRDLFNKEIYEEIGLAQPRALKNRLQSAVVGSGFLPLQRTLHFIETLP